MKNLIFILSLLVSNMLMSNELSWVDEQIQAIKPPRKGMKHSDISSIVDPFIFLSKNKDKKTSEPKKISTSQKQGVSIASTKPVVKTKILHKALSLGIILNNSAMIDGKWYKVGDFISGYRVAKVNKVSVVLKNKDKKLLLSIKSISNTLKFQK